MSQADAVKKVERLISHALTAFRQGTVNTSKTEVMKNRYQEQPMKTSWHSFVQRADYSYFVAESSSLRGVHLYGLFCTHQCVEGYLKAFLRLSKSSIPQSHNLLNILSKVRECNNDTNGFLHSDYSEAICRRYDPFYEVARYPAQQTRPKDGIYAVASSIDGQFIDYFVYRMREIMPLPQDGWDILKQGHMELEIVKELRPSFYSIFTDGNLNFAPNEP